MGANYSKVFGSKSFNPDQVPAIVQNTKNILKEYRIDALMAQVNSTYSIHMCFHRVTGKRFILRKYTGGAEELPHLMAELDMYEDLLHPYTTKVIEYFKTSHTIFVIVDDFEGSLLSDYLAQHPKIDEAEIIKIVKQLLTLVNYLHGKKIINRNITLRNIMYDGSTIKLINFNLATRYKSGQRFKEVVSGLYYRAPEMVKKRYNSRVDVWAVGVVAYILMAGQPPFDGAKELQTSENILTQEIDLEPLKKNCASDLACDFIEQIFIKSKNMRPKANKLLQNQWITKLGRISSEFRLNYQFVDNVRSFNFKTDFQIVIYSFLISKLASDFDRQKAIKEFNKFDVDNNGILSKSEIVSGLKKLNSSITEEDAVAIFGKMDRNKTRVIEFEEFLEVFINREQFMKEDNLGMCFDYIDTKALGSISLKDLEKIFGNMVESSYVKSMFSKYSKNHFMNKENFIKMLKEASA